MHIIGTTLLPCLLKSDPLFGEVSTCQACHGVKPETGQEARKRAENEKTSLQALLTVSLPLLLLGAVGFEVVDPMVFLGRPYGIILPIICLRYSKGAYAMDASCWQGLVCPR